MSFIDGRAKDMGEAYQPSARWQKVIQFCIKAQISLSHSLESLFEAGLDLQNYLQQRLPLPQHKDRAFQISPEATSITETQQMLPRKPDIGYIPTSGGCRAMLTG